MLRVKDDGDGVPEGVHIKNANRIGLTMVNQLVVGQLKGEICFNHDDGTDIRI